MPPRTKLTKHIAPGTKTSMEEMEISGWERSKISNQDQSTLNRLGLLKKKDALIFPGDESFPTPRIGYRVTFIDHLIRGLSTPIHEFLRGLLFVYGIQLHQLTPNSILHISIFITLCECFLGTHPHWGLWKRIFYLRRNSSRNIAYNVGGVIICVRPDVDYFDVKFPDSVQGWRRRWLYIQEEYIGLQEYNIAPFDGTAKILRRRSWNAEATTEEKSATDALMKRIRELQNTRGQELSGVQITAYFLRIRVQPLQARKNPLWIYAGKEDVDRVSKDLSVKDLENLIRRFSSLSKKHDVPTTCRVEPYSGNHALPENHQVLCSLPPLPKGGEVDERAVVTDDSQGPSRPESEVAGSHKSAASSERSESDASESAHSPPSAVSPKDKRKRDEVEDSGTSKATDPAAEEMSPEEEGAFNPYDDVGSVSSGEEEEKEEPEVHGTALTSTSHTLVLFEERRAAEESSPPPQQDMETSPLTASPRAPAPKRARIGAGDSHAIVAGGSSTSALDDPVMKHLIQLGTQFIGFRDAAEDMRGPPVPATVVTSPRSSSEKTSSELRLQEPLLVLKEPIDRLDHPLPCQNLAVGPKALPVSPRSPSSSASMQLCPGAKLSYGVVADSEPAWAYEKAKPRLLCSPASSSLRHGKLPDCFRCRRRERHW
ncbi:hypothetical protein QYE76_008666 [Lolium multiflorum]|uniref:Transposase (putative) gypsy type domain-containing protein n=1 Tax=Lolium multiflorum TaxID=4521 RepID=A0AAD8X2V3_LOLMU|nr:hypothetical protein QYE76_008666 [Lolium multiflorum]